MNPSQRNTLIGVVVFIFVLGVLFLVLWLSGVFSPKATTTSASTTPVILTPSDLLKAEFTVTPNQVEFYRGEQGTTEYNEFVRDVNSRLTLTTTLTVSPTGENSVPNIKYLTGYRLYLVDNYNMIAGSQKVYDSETALQKLPTDTTDDSARVLTATFDKDDFGPNDADDIIVYDILRQLRLKVEYKTKGMGDNEYRLWGTINITDKDDNLAKALVDLDQTSGYPIQLGVVLSDELLQSQGLTSELTIGPKIVKITPYEIYHDDSIDNDSRSLSVEMNSTKEYNSGTDRAYTSMVNTSYSHLKYTGSYLPAQVSVNLNRDNMFQDIVLFPASEVRYQGTTDSVFSGGEYDKMYFILLFYDANGAERDPSDFFNYQHLILSSTNDAASTRYSGIFGSYVQRDKDVLKSNYMFHVEIIDA